MRYPALVDGEAGAYGVVFPDLGIGAMGATVEQAIKNGEELLRDYVEEMEMRGWLVDPPSAMEKIDTPPGNMLVSIPLVRSCDGPVFADLEADQKAKSSPH